VNPNGVRKYLNLATIAHYRVIDYLKLTNYRNWANKKIKSGDSLKECQLITAMLHLNPMAVQ